MRNIVIVRNPDRSVESDCTVVDRSFNLEVVQMEAAACECSCVSHSQVLLTVLNSAAVLVVRDDF